MQEVTVGSSVQCDLNIANDFVSRKHCKLLYSSNGVWIEDLGSSNGTYVNGKRLSPDQRKKIDPTSNVTLAEEIEITWEMVRAFRPDRTTEKQTGPPSPSKDPSPKPKRPKEPSPKRSSSPSQNQQKSKGGGRSTPEKKEQPRTPDAPQEVNVSVNTGSSDSQESEGSIVGAIFTMLAVSLLLFWLPFIGPVIAGYAGGKKAGGLGNAVLATLLPAVVAGILAFVLAGSISGIPILGAIAGVGTVVLILVHVGPLLLGAIMGGVSA